jgi:DNA (cytosine-5)-methyltransferase 1
VTPGDGRIPVLSFFTGGGLMDIGFEMAGFRVIWTNEFNKTFAGLYKHAFSAWRQAEGRGAEVEFSSTRSVAGLKAQAVINEAFPTTVPEVFGVIGGPPCPDFSQGGKKKGFNGKNGKLTRSYFKLLEEIRPTFFLIENVPGLVRYGKSKTVFDRLITGISEKGEYIVRYDILNALEHGVPQDRERLFVIGLRKDYFRNFIPEPMESSWEFPWPKDPKYEGVRKLKWPTTGKFKGSPTIPKGIPEELTAGYAFKRLPKPESLPNGKATFKAKSEKIGRIEEGDISGMSFKRLHRHRYSPTAWYGNNEVHLHPWKVRRLSVREAMRLQTVPDSYAFPEEATLSAMFKVIGNGVPCLLAKAVALALKSVLKQGQRRR